MEVVTNNEFFYPYFSAIQKPDDFLTPEEQLVIDHYINYQRQLDEYRKGNKPYCIRITSGAWKGSILRPSQFTWDNLSSSVEMVKRVTESYSSKDPVYRFDVQNECKLHTGWRQASQSILVTDEGKEYKSLFDQADSEVLLDYTGPTQIICTRKVPEKREKKVWPTTIVDDFGNVMKEGDIGIYTDKDFNQMGLVKFCGFDRRNTVNIFGLSSRQTWTRMLGYFSIIKVNVDETSLMMMTIIDGEETKYSLKDFKISTPDAILKVLTGDDETVTPV